MIQNYRRILFAKQRADLRARCFWLDYEGVEIYLTRGDELTRF